MFTNGARVLTYPHMIILKDDDSAWISAHHAPRRRCQVQEDRSCVVGGERLRRESEVFSKYGGQHTSKLMFILLSDFENFANSSPKCSGFSGFQGQPRVEALDPAMNCPWLTLRCHQTWLAGKSHVNMEVSGLENHPFLWWIFQHAVFDCWRVSKN